MIAANMTIVNKGAFQKVPAAAVPYRSNCPLFDFNLSASVTTFAILGAP